MTLQTRFFVGLTGIKLPFATDRGERFTDDFWITTDKELVRNLVEPYKNQIGSVEYRFSTEACPCIIYSRSDAPEQVHPDLEKFAAQYTEEGLLKVHALLHGLWLVKDNAATEDRGWTVIAQAPGHLLVLESLEFTQKYGQWQFM